MAKRRFTNAQRKAYYSGMGYRIAHDGKKIRFENSAMQDSFTAGYRNGGRKLKRKPRKYPKLKK